MKKIVFFNQAHYGDLFVSRSFIKEICEQLPDNCYSYYHKYKPKYLFNDINLEEYSLDNNINVICDAAFNTWYAADNHKYYETTGCTIQTLYKLFTDVYSHLNIELLDIKNYIPKINFTKYNLIEEKRNKKCILICNNIPLSGQSSTSDMTELIEKIAKESPNKIIFVTNDVSKKLNFSNVFYTKNILKNNNLIEISWLSTQCGMVIGRASGPYTFSILKDNLNDGVKYIEITHSNFCGQNNNLSNFGLHKLGYDNFTNVDCDKSWEDIGNIILSEVNKNV